MTYTKSVQYSGSSVLTPDAGPSKNQKDSDQATWKFVSSLGKDVYRRTKSDSGADQLDRTDRNMSTARCVPQELCDEEHVDSSFKALYYNGLRPFSI